MSAIQNAIREGDVQALEVALKAQPEAINKPDFRGFPPLILASYTGSFELTERLLKHGAEVNIQDASGNTALMGTAFKGLTQIAELLIQHGADVNKQNKDGSTALDFAKKFNQQGIVDILGKNGAQ